MCSTRIVSGVSVLPTVVGQEPLMRTLSSDSTTGVATKTSTVIKEGVVDKESHGVVYSWRPRFCVLTKDHLTIFRSDPRRSSGGGGSPGVAGDSDPLDEHHRTPTRPRSERAERRNILYRLSLDEISTMSNIDKGRRHIHFTICTKQGVFDLRVAFAQRDWLTQIQLAVAERKNRHDFMRELKKRTSVVANKYRKHNHRRLSFAKDEEYGDGIGITIRNDSETIVVARVFSGGPAAKKGTLRPGDEIIEVDGKAVRGLNAERVASIIKGLSSHVVLIVKPTCVDRGTNTSPADFALSRPLYTRPNNLRGRARPHSLADVVVATDPETQGAANLVNDVTMSIDRKTFRRIPPVKNKNKQAVDNRLSLP